jgi:parallel beta-helix repeat protein
LQQATGVSITNTGNCYFRNVATYVTYTPTATTIKGFDVNGAAANASLTLDTCAADFPALVSGGVPVGGFTSYGFYIHGTTIKDLFLRGCQGSNVGYGVYIDGTGGTSSYDLHFLDTIVDTFFVSAFYFNQLGVTSTVEVNGGWTNPAAIGAVAYNVYAATSHGITLTNVTLFGGPNNANQQGVRLASCADIVVSSCIFKNFQYGIYSNGSGLCTFIGNSFYNITGQNGVTAIYADATSYRLGINSNNVNGQVTASWTTGIVTIAGCDYCNVVANTLNAGVMTTTVNVNAGTNTHTYLAGVVS